MAINEEESLRKCGDEEKRHSRILGNCVPILSSALILVCLVYAGVQLTRAIPETRPAAVNLLKPAAASMEPNAHINQVGIVNARQLDGKTLVILERELARQSKLEQSKMDVMRRLNSDTLPTVRRFGNLSADDLCQRERNLCAPPFQVLLTELWYSRRHRLVGCPIEKNMSSLLRALMCLLADEETFIKGHHHIKTELNEINFCRNNASLQWFGPTKHRFPALQRQLQGYRFFAIVRDPIERLLSGFVDKCIRKLHGPHPCNGCHANLTCFLERELDKMQFAARRHTERTDFEDAHFYPQNWHCSFGVASDAYTTIRYSSAPNQISNVIGQLLSVFKERGVSEATLRIIDKQLRDGRTVHSTVQSPMIGFLRNRLMTSPYLLELVVRMFYHDFRLFGFDIPPLGA